MNILPADLPRLRDEILRRIASPEHADLIRRDIKSGYVHPRFGGHETELFEFESAVLRMSCLYFVSPEMTAVAKAAGRTLDDFALRPDDVPDSHGFLVFGGEPIPVPEGTWPFDFQIVAYSWAEEPGIGVLFQPLADRDAMLAAYQSVGASNEHNIEYSRRKMSPLMPIGRQLWHPYGAESVADNGASYQAPALRVLRAAWLLMRQPLAITTDAVFDRATRRRLAREYVEPPTVRVITLRRPANSGGSGESDREYHHQWIVRGHWRQQWYRSRGVNRPVWIAPHVKGPEGAPMLGGEKVYAWTR